jgi:hypothetical protein
MFYNFEWVVTKQLNPEAKLFGYTFTNQICQGLLGQTLTKMSFRQQIICPYVEVEYFVQTKVLELWFSRKIWYLHSM